MLLHNVWNIVNGFSEIGLHISIFVQIFSSPMKKGIINNHNHVWDDEIPYAIGQSQHQ